MFTALKIRIKFQNNNAHLIECLIRKAIKMYVISAISEIIIKRYIYIYCI